jgi:hypothetical protein
LWSLLVMRKFLIPLLLASALTPAAAHADPGDRGDRARSDRSEPAKSSDAKSSNDRPQRAERADRPERPQRAERVVAQDRPQRAERVERVNGSGDAERVRPVRVQRADRPARVDRNVQQVVTTQPAQPVQIERSRGGLVEGFRSLAREEQANRSGDHDGWRHDRDGDNHRWNGDWRRDNRYDWHSYRNRYSSLYRLGRYHDPYGWGYRRFSIGFNLWPSYYGSNNWLNDPWQYRLPPAYGPYRWVRYYEDALLVNIYTGQVVDVINNFFW